MAKEKTALVPYDSQLPAVSDGGKILEALRENLGEDGGLSVRDFPLASVPSGGLRVWSIGEGDDAKTAPAITGVIIQRSPYAVYWATPFGAGSGGRTPPDCASRDGRTGHGHLGDGEVAGRLCRDCPMRQYGTRKNPDGSLGAAPACARRMALFVLAADSILPIAVMLPGTSVRAWERYGKQLAGAGKVGGEFGRPYWAVETEITLRAEQSQGGVDYSVASFRAVRSLGPEEIEATRQYAEGIRELLAETVESAAAGDAEPIVEA